MRKRLPPRLSKAFIGATCFICNQYVERHDRLMQHGKHRLLSIFIFFSTQLNLIFTFFLFTGEARCLLIGEITGKPE